MFRSHWTTTGAVCNCTYYVSEFNMHFNNFLENKWGITMHKQLHGGWLPSSVCHFSQCVEYPLACFISHPEQSLRILIWNLARHKQLHRSTVTPFSWNLKELLQIFMKWWEISLAWVFYVQAFIISCVNGNTSHWERGLGIDIDIVIKRKWQHKGEKRSSWNSGQKGCQGELKRFLIPAQLHCGHNCHHVSLWCLNSSV